MGTEGRMLYYIDRYPSHYNCTVELHIHTTTTYIYLVSDIVMLVYGRALGINDLGDHPDRQAKWYVQVWRSHYLLEQVSNVVTSVTSVIVSTLGLTLQDYWYMYVLCSSTVLLFDRSYCSTVDQNRSNTAILSTKSLYFMEYLYEFLLLFLIWHQSWFFSYNMKIIHILFLKKKSEQK